jgi:hypothetical protein
MSMMYNSFAQQWEYHRRGQTTPTSWDQMLLSMRWQSRGAGVAQWWSEYRELFSPEFGDFVDGLIREGEAAG